MFFLSNAFPEITRHLYFIWKYFGSHDFTLIKQQIGSKIVNKFIGCIA